MNGFEDERGRNFQSWKGKKRLTTEREECDCSHIRWNLRKGSNLVWAWLLEEQSSLDGRAPLERQWSLGGGNYFETYLEVSDLKRTAANIVSLRGRGGGQNRKNSLSSLACVMYQRQIRSIEPLKMSWKMWRRAMFSSGWLTATENST